MVFNGNPVAVSQIETKDKKTRRWTLDSVMYVISRVCKSCSHTADRVAAMCFQIPMTHSRFKYHTANGYFSRLRECASLHIRTSQTSSLNRDNVSTRKFHRCF